MIFLLLHILRCSICFACILYVWLANNGGAIKRFPKSIHVEQIKYFCGFITNDISMLEEELQLEHYMRTPDISHERTFGLIKLCWWKTEEFIEHLSSNLLRIIFSKLTMSSDLLICILLDTHHMCEHMNFVSSLVIRLMCILFAIFICNAFWYFKILTSHYFTLNWRSS